MHIILDTNIIIKDPYIKNSTFKILKDFINKTNSVVVLPKLVIDEAVGLHIKAIQKKIDAFKSALADVQRIGLIEMDIEEQFLDIDAHKLRYRELLIKELQVSSHNILDYCNDHLPEIIRRSIERIKPAKEDGKQFRDISLWLTIKDHLRKMSGENVVFISENHSDFGAINKIDLHSDLSKELENEGLKIGYYTRLDNFLEQYAEPIDFITNEWLIKNFNYDTVEQYLKMQYILDEAIIIDKIKTRLERNQEFSDYTNVTDYSNVSIMNQIVFQLQNGEILIELVLQLSGEIEYGYIERIEINYIKESIVIKYSGDGTPYQEFDIQPVWHLDFEHGNYSYGEDIIINCIVTVIDKKIEKYEFTNYEYE